MLHRMWQYTSLKAFWRTRQHFKQCSKKNWQMIKSLLFVSLLYHPTRWYYAAAKPLQSCPTLCDPIDGSLPGSPVPGILQARTLEWVAISFSNVWKWKVKVKSLSHIRLFATPRTAVYQASPSIVFSRQEYWSGVPLPSPRWYYTIVFIRITWQCPVQDGNIGDFSTHLLP